MPSRNLAGSHAGKDDPAGQGGLGPSSPCEQTSPSSGRLGLKVVERDTVRGRIYKELRRALQAGKFAPGEAITVKYLEDAFGAGTTPIREALQRLCAEGALVILPTGRVRVPLFTAEEFDEINEGRLRLEGWAAHRAALQRTDAELDQIRRCLDQLNLVMRSRSSWKEVIEQNYQFHFAVFGAAHTRHIIGLIDSLWLRVSPLLSLAAGMAPGATTDYVAMHDDNHAQLVRAIADQDGRAAESAMREIILMSSMWFHRHHAFD